MNNDIDEKVLVVSYNGFSESNANGKTLKYLMKTFNKEQLAQFYCGDETPDVDFCANYFHVSDVSMCKSFLLKKAYTITNAQDYAGKAENKDVEYSCSGEISKRQRNSVLQFLRKHNYSYFLRMLREVLWCIAPWGKKQLYEWISSFKPAVVLYMVGDSWFLDKLVLKIVSRNNIPLVLYNAEAYRLIDLKERRGLDYFYNKIIIKSFEKLTKIASFYVFNSEFLKNGYISNFKNIINYQIYYNTSSFETVEKEQRNQYPIISYFGNLGVGRVETLLMVGNALSKIDSNLSVDVYGQASSEDEKKLNDCRSLRYHGKVQPEKLKRIKDESDILIHVESFDPSIQKKLKYAFSTKIAQYLCAGRCVVTIAPEKLASTQYLRMTKAAYIINDRSNIKEQLEIIINDQNMRTQYAKKAIEIAKKNHDLDMVSNKFKLDIKELLRCIN